MSFMHSLTSFFGITNLQTLIYYKRYPNDWWIYRYSVSWNSFRVSVILKPMRQVALLWSVHSSYRWLWFITKFFYRGLDALHVVLSTHALYRLLIDWYGNVAADRGNDEWYGSVQWDDINCTEELSVQELQGILPTYIGSDYKASNQISVTQLQLAIIVGL